jgi:hypothetical protein
MIATVVANGQDNYASYLAWLGGSPLDTRIATYLSLYDQVLSVSVDDKSRLFSIWGGTYPYQATIRLDTKNNAADIASIVERVKLAIVQATGIMPSAVSVTSAGQPMPAAPEPGLVDETSDIVSSVAQGLNITTKAATVLLVAVGIGAIALVYFIATKPASAARIARG